MNHTFVLKSFIKDNAPELCAAKLKSLAEAWERFNVLLRLVTARKTIISPLPVDSKFFDSSKFEDVEGDKFFD